MTHDTVVRNFLTVRALTRPPSAPDNCVRRDAIHPHPVLSGVQVNTLSLGPILFLIYINEHRRTGRVVGGGGSWPPKLGQI